MEARSFPLQRVPQDLVDDQVLLAQVEQREETAVLGERGEPPGEAPIPAGQAAPRGTRVGPAQVGLPRPPAAEWVELSDRFPR